jgi:hypothetical protein
VTGWLKLPGTVADRMVFQLVARSQANPPFFISGGGTRENPWQLRTLAARQTPETGNAPLVVSLGDDAGAFFQSSPPSPIDMAVILSNFQRLGADKAAVAAVMAWDEADPISLAALDKVLARFDALVMAAPLARGAVSEPMPDAFRNASLPVGHVTGDASALPVVNRIPLSGVILGRGDALAGFQWIDHETETRSTPLIARWDDRIVFAFPLLVALQRFDLPLQGLEIRPGEYLKLAPQGPVVPLDRYGRMMVSFEEMTPYAEVPAELLIDGGEDLFPKTAPRPVILRDDRSALVEPSRVFSKQLPALVALIASDSSLVPVRYHARFSESQEIVVLGLSLACVLLIARMANFARNVGYLLLGVGVVGIHFVAAASGVWLPTLAVLCGILAACIVSKSGHVMKAYRRPADG